MATFRLSDFSVVDVRGDDATKILNNLTTADLSGLAIGGVTETFVTEVRGRTLGHGYVRRENDGLRFVGPPGQSDAVRRHIEKYTIREDARAEVVEASIVVDGPPEAGADLGGANDGNEAEGAGAWPAAWLGPGTTLRVIEGIAAGEVELERHEGTADFHDRRIVAGYPWHGVDFDDANLPQEVGRDDAAISFTKGCYLGQETVARLDALGQVQKQLRRVRIEQPDATLRPGDTFAKEGKPVLKITSVTTDGSMAIAMIRRGHFDPGNVVEAVDGSGRTLVATVET